MNYFEEKEEEWGKLRWGMFTGSRISELFVMDKNGCFGKGAMSYINKVACESYTEYEHNEFKGTWQMRQGKINEPMCAKYYFSIMNQIQLPVKEIRWEYYGANNPLFKKYNDYSGTSPDAIGFINNKAYITAEFKCPTRDVHFERLQQLKKFKSEEEYLWLKSAQLDHYTQIQFNIMNFDCEIGHWISYNPFFKEPHTAIIITVPKDVDFCNKLKIILEMANTEKNKIINLLKTKNDD